MRVVARCICVLSLTALVAVHTAGHGRAATASLLSQADLTYIGAFKLPSGTFGNPSDTLDYAGGFVTGTVYDDPAYGKTFFMSGYLSSLMVSNAVRVVQIKIPATVNDPNVVGLSGLSTATAVQGFTDPSRGIGTQILGSDQGFGSFVVYGGKLIGTEAVAYDASGTQTSSAWVSSLNFSLNQASGPYKFSESVPQRIIGGGFMTIVPAEWRSALGGSVVSGNGPTSIISQGTAGPSLHVIDADSLIAQPAAGTVIQSSPLVYYTCPSGNTADQVNCHQTLGAWNSNDPNQTWNGLPIPNLTVVDPHGRGTFKIAYEDNSARMQGILFADGTRSVLFFGHKGLGPYCYGIGSNCGDIDSPDIKGDHAYPYTEFVWAYDVLDLAAVRAGSKKPWEVYPYSGWAFKVFGDGDGGEHCCNGKPVGVAWDPATRLAYMVVGFTNDSAPLVHVFRVATPGTPPPTAPTGLRITP